MKHQLIMTNIFTFQ